MNAPLRLSPTMGSRKLLALEFIRQYWAKWNGSPSLQEIAEALRTSRSHARAVVLQLAADGSIDYRARARRGITLPSARDQALRLLLAQGFTLFIGARQIVPPQGARTNTTLPLVCELDHIPYVSGGDRHDGSDGPDAGGG